MQTPRLQDDPEALERLRKKILASPKAARAFLRKVGIVDAKGRLTKPYGGSPD